MLVIVKDENEAQKIDKKNQQAIEASNIKNQSSQGEQNNQIPDKKVGRNEPCPCGSGKKFKHCCGALN